MTSENRKGAAFPLGECRFPALFHNTVWLIALVSVTDDEVVGKADDGRLSRCEDAHMDADLVGTVSLQDADGVVFDFNGVMVRAIGDREGPFTPFRG